jgi:AcrR family transcriptional regulator
MPDTRQATTDATRSKLERAALKLFLRHGFNGVGLRDLAKEAALSLGAVYNHYESKDALFAALIESQYASFAAATEPLAQFLVTCRLPDDLEKFGAMMGEMVARHRAYLTLVYVDIAEFGGKHARPHYQGLAAKFRAVMPSKQRHVLPAWADPGVVFTILYMQFANHFVVEKLIGAEHYLGMTEGDSIKTIAKLFMLGLAPREPRRPSTSQEEAS